jgi:hypothetical protein
MRRALYRTRFRKTLRRISFDTSDIFDAVLGDQQLRLFNTDQDEYNSQPIVVFVSCPPWPPCCARSAAGRARATFRTVQVA